MNNFEERLTQLEDLGEKIQKQGVSLEEALECFESGMKLARGMEKELEKIEGKVQKLLNGEEAGDAEEMDEDTFEEKSTKKGGGKKQGTAASLSASSRPGPSMELFAG